MVVGPCVANEGGISRGPRGARSHVRLASRDRSTHPSNTGRIRGAEMYCNISGRMEMYCDISGGTERYCNISVPRQMS